MKPIRIPLFGSPMGRNPNPSAFSTSDQRFTNCYPQVYKNPISGKTTVFLNKRPGCSAGVTTNTTRGSFGSCVWTSNSATVSPKVFSFVQTGNATEVWNSVVVQVGGDIANTTNCFALTSTSIAGTGNLVGIFEDSATSVLEAWYFPEGGAWTQITDTDFPPNQTPAVPIVGAPVHMDGFMFILTASGQLWNSDVNSLSAWTANSYITAQSSPDKGVTLSRYKDMVVAFGAHSIEFFRNIGNPTNSPLSRVPDSTINIGVSQTNFPAVLAVGETVYFIGTENNSGKRGVYRFNGMQAEKISNILIDALLMNIGGAGFIGSCNLHGMTHVVIDNNGVSSNMPCFCVDIGMWWFLTFGQDIYPRALLGAESSQGVVLSYFLDGKNTGNIYLFGNAGTPLYQDAGTAYTATIQTENLDFGTDLRKFMPSLRVIGDTQTAASLLGISWSDDDFATFSTARNIDLNTTQKNLTRLVSFRRRSFRLTHAANTPCRLEALEFPNLKVGRT